MVLMRGHNICFLQGIRKIMFFDLFLLPLLSGALCNDYELYWTGQDCVCKILSDNLKYCAIE